MDTIERLRRSLEASPVVRMGGYEYFVHPIADGVPALDPSELEAVAILMAEMMDMSFDRLLTVEALGIPVATAISLILKVPLTVVRKKKYGLPGEVSVRASTGYASHELYLNGLRRGERVVFVDDVLSTGGTLRAVASALHQVGAVLCGVFVVIDKSSDKSSLERELGVRIGALVRVRLEGGRVRTERLLDAQQAGNEVRGGKGG
ncbi:MAG: hypoxanthine/guanine phosphoribosyltransferase [Thermoplasmata archaeon]